MTFFDFLNFFSQLSCPRIAGQTNCSSQEAWVHAAIKASKSRAAFCPTDNLAPVLWRYLAWQASTSAVEQGFSKCDYFNACGRTPASAEHESKTMRILLTPMTETEANGPMTWSMLPKNYMFNVALRPQDCQFNLVQESLHSLN